LLVAERKEADKSSSLLTERVAVAVPRSANVSANSRISSISSQLAASPAASREKATMAYQTRSVGQANTPDYRVYIGTEASIAAKNQL
jgi:hypothetical protein